MGLRHCGIHGERRHVRTLASNSSEDASKRLPTDAWFIQKIALSRLRRIVDFIRRAEQLELCILRRATRTLPLVRESIPNQKSARSSWPLPN